MIGLYISRRFISTNSQYLHRLIGSLCLSSDTFRSLQIGYESSASSSFDDLSKKIGIIMPLAIPSMKNHQESFHIELADSNIWPISLNRVNSRQEISSNVDEDVYDDEIPNEDFTLKNYSPDFDEIEELRVQNKLFYKVDRGSKEFEECSFTFHRKKSSKKMQRDNQIVKTCKKSEKPSAKSSSTEKNIMRTKNPNSVSSASVVEAKKKVRTFASNENLMKTERLCSVPKASAMEAKKKVRTLTFNQLTDPYHLPFCLDIFITKGSVRASVIHRVTSKVVAVAHSISKDLKFDLSCKKDARACVAVGEVLAQRAIEDDIHNVVYTPRKGDKIEGKLQIVLQSVIDHGVDVKLKLKQKNTL